MKEKKNCKIVQDLLPNYIEKLTNEETNQFIEEHLNECEECKKIAENMKKEIELNTPKRNEKEVKYIKKYSKKLKILRNILLVILIIALIFLGCTLRKFLIIKGLQKRADKIAKSVNYHISISSIGNLASQNCEYYVKDGKMACIIERYGNDGKTSRVLAYRKNENGKTNIYMETQDRKKAYLNTGGIANLPQLVWPIIDTEPNNFELFFICSKLKLKKVEQFYFIDNSSYVYDFEFRNQMYIDTETGLRKRIVTLSGSSSYEYEFDNVDDSVFIEPDISEYTIQDDNN